MSSGVKECYDWGVLGCGWLGQAFARHIVSLGGTVWGSARSAASLNSIQHVGATAVPFDAQSGEFPSFPPCRNLLVAWPPQVGASATKRAIEQCRTHHTVWTVCISSTSVYPDSPKVYTEGLAERRISPHSGVCVLDIEKATAGPAVSHLRAGGLLGPERPLYVADWIDMHCASACSASRSSESMLCLVRSCSQPGRCAEPAPMSACGIVRR